jgi:hypothetical protein
VRENDDVAKRQDGEKASHGAIYGRRCIPAQQRPRKLARYCDWL